MNKEKQIEDLTAIIDSFYIRTYEDAQAVAKFIIEKYNYRKINEDEFVMSNEEWKRIKNAIYFSKEALERKLEKARKETAREIFNAIKSKNQYEYFSYDDDKYCVSSDSIEELAKQFGVEIGEEV